MATDVTGDYVDFMKKQYMQVRSVHENLSKSYHKAASWHDDQMKKIDKMVEEIDTKSMKDKVTKSDDRRADLIAILEDHISEFGSLGLSPDAVADIVLN